MIINKLISFYLILLGGILLGGSPIRDAAEKYIISQFDVDVSIYMHTLKLDTELKVLVQNKVKQRFYRDELYYWNKNWLAQFTHFNDTTDFKVGKNIDGISGATISVNSLSKGIQKMAVLFPFIKDKLN